MGRASSTADEQAADARYGLIDDVGDPPKLGERWFTDGDGQRCCVKYITGTVAPGAHLPAGDIEVVDPVDSIVAAHIPPPALSPKAERLKDILRGIVGAIGADLAATDLSRVLRLPGFLNRKNERMGRPPRPCSLVGLLDGEKGGAA